MLLASYLKARGGQSRAIDGPAHPITDTGEISGGQRREKLGRTFVFEFQDL